MQIVDNCLNFIILNETGWCCVKHAQCCLLPISIANNAAKQLKNALNTQKKKRGNEQNKNKGEIYFHFPLFHFLLFMQICSINSVFYPKLGNGFFSLKFCGIFICPFNGKFLSCFPLRFYVITTTKGILGTCLEQQILVWWVTSFRKCFLCNVAGVAPGKAETLLFPSW